MLPKSKKAKGKQLEKYVAKKFSEIYSFAYARADSGSGKHKKEDVTLPDSAPFFIECKNQAEARVSEWWKQTIYHCPQDKIPVLVYKLNYQKNSTVVMTLGDLVRVISGVDPSLWGGVLVSFLFEDFLSVLKK